MRALIGQSAVGSHGKIARLLNYYIKAIDHKFRNGNRTEWSPVQSVIIRVITKPDDRGAGGRFVYHARVRLQTELDYTKSYYQLIIKVAISEKKKNSQVMKKGEDWLPEKNTKASASARSA